MRLSILPFHLAALALLSACATSQPTSVVVPEAIRAPAGEKVAMILPARGVQVYECRAKKDQPSVYEWAFVGPEADLFNTSGAKIGRHYGGPTWEANDGSKVVAGVAGRADVAGTIPWLRLTTKSVEGPAGAFSKVTSIQRVNTVGGVSPASACAQGNAGAQARVPYTADYYLLAKS